MEASKVPHFANDSAADLEALNAREGHGIHAKDDHQCPVSLAHGQCKASLHPNGFNDGRQLSELLS